MRTSPRIRFVAFLLAGALVYSTAFVGTVIAAPDSTVATTVTESGPFNTPYVFPAFGWQRGDSGEVWAECDGMLATPGDIVHNSASSAWSHKRYTGVITDVDEGAWELEAFCFLDVSAQVSYVPSAPVWVENHRGEATGTVETRGDFGNILNEAEVAVDNYTTPGLTIYDATGYEGDVYANAGDYIVKASTAPNRGRERATATPGVTVSDWHFSLGCDFYLYCKAHQYIHSNEEEDVEHIITDVSEVFVGQPGWQGDLKSYQKIGGVWHLVNIHPIP